MLNFKSLSNSSLKSSETESIIFIPINLVSSSLIEVNIPFSIVYAATSSKLIVKFY